VYKLRHDNGAAPCVHGDDLLTLAICKPRIRTTATVGDIIFGFAANSLSPDNRLIYIARVTRVEFDGDYYGQAIYTQRPDCIYVRGTDAHFHIRPDARFHEDGSLLRNDLGIFPEYDRASVLVSEDFRYFGSSYGSPVVDLEPYPYVLEMLRSLGQGHRVNHPPEREAELRRLLHAVWAMYPAKVSGSPITSEDCAQVDARRSKRSYEGCG
jgi:hypothetical protein